MAASAWATDSQDKELHIGILEVKNILVTGVTMNTSITYHVADIAMKVRTPRSWSVTLAGPSA